MAKKAIALNTSMAETDLIWAELGRLSFHGRRGTRPRFLAPSLQDFSLAFPLPNRKRRLDGPLSPGPSGGKFRKI